MRALGLPKIIGFYLLMAVVALVIIWRRDEAVLWSTALGTDWIRTVAAGLGLGAVMVLVSRGMTARFTWARTLDSEFRRLLGPLTGWEALLLALSSGISEELLFRGVLQPALGLWLAASVFGVLHIGPNRRFLPWTAMAFVAGAAFGLLLQWTGSLAAPILAHATVNFFNLRFLTAEDTHPEVHLQPMGGEHLVGR